MAQAPAQTSEGKLFRSWSVWYLIPDRYSMRDANWNDFLHEIGTFDTIQNFWDIFNSLEKSSHLPKGCRHYFFKTGIRPLWEDRQNTNGFEIALEHKITKQSRPKVSDRFLDILLALIGETIPNSELINGIEFRSRSETWMICFWVAPCSDEIRQQFAQFLETSTKWTQKATITPIKA